MSAMGANNEQCLVKHIKDFNSDIAVLPYSGYPRTTSTLQQAEAGYDHQRWSQKIMVREIAVRLAIGHNISDTSHEE